MTTIKADQRMSENDLAEFMGSYLTELKSMSDRWPEMNYYLTMALEEAKSQTKLMSMDTQ